MIPSKIRSSGATELSILWDDGHNGLHLLQTLRKYCPCASCKTDLEVQEGRFALPVVQPGQNELRGIDPVGNYALQLRWGDGHQTGIYTYAYLRQICECQECKKTTAE